MIARCAAARREPQLVLASASPRRRLILDSLRLSYRPVETQLDERPREGESPEDLALRLALAKAKAGASGDSHAVALGADTVVAQGRVSLGKPCTPEDAYDMLRRLRGRWHRVITAVAVARANPASREMATWQRMSVTRVRMRDFGDDEIRAYVGTGDPLDKAGGYAIQDRDFHPVQEIEGCFLTVVGLPLPEVCDLLECAGAPRPKIGLSTLEALCPACTDRERLLGQAK